MSETVSVLVYSNNREIRAQVMAAVGSRLGTGLPQLAWHEVATGEIARDELLTGKYPLAVLDGEAAKISGMVVAKTVHEEMAAPPRIVLVVARPQDNWLATWSGADEIIATPVDPMQLQDAIITQVRELSRD